MTSNKIFIKAGRVYMAENLKETLDTILTSVERLLKLFELERKIHLIIGIVGFLILIYACFLLIRSKELSVELLVSLFGSSGLIITSSARITYFFNKAFNLIENIIGLSTKELK